MAIGIAVDILGCTGTLENRASTLNKIIQVAVELKDAMGDLYSFSAIMKALEMPQVRRWLCAACHTSVLSTVQRVISDFPSQLLKINRILVTAALVIGSQEYCPSYFGSVYKNTVTADRPHLIFDV